MDLRGSGFKLGRRRERWLRGPASLEGDWVLLDRVRGQPYYPETSADRVGAGHPLVELAAVRSRDDVRGFVERFGLLRNGPDSPSQRESVREWQQQATVLSTLLALYQDTIALMGRQSDPEAAAEFKEKWETTVRRSFDARARSDAELLGQAAILLADTVSKQLNGARERVSVAADDSGPRAFIFDAATPDLLSHIYHQLGVLMVASVPVRECADGRCGRFFTVADARMRYCSRQHATRARVAHLRLARAEAKEGDQT